MSFNVQDKQSVATAQDAGLNKAQEIATALLRLAQKGELNFKKLLKQRHPSEDINDTDPNITNERHELYAQAVDKYERFGADSQTAKDAAIDFAIRDMGADTSAHISKAHDQINFQQTLLNEGISSEQINSLAQLRNEFITLAENWVADEPFVYPLEDPQTPNFREQLVEAGLQNDLALQLEEQLGERMDSILGDQDNLPEAKVIPKKKSQNTTQTQPIELQQQPAAVVNDPSSQQLTENSGSNHELAECSPPELSFRQRLAEAGVDVNVAKELSKQRDSELSAIKQAVQKGEPAPIFVDDFKSQLSTTSLGWEDHLKFVDEFDADRAAIEKGTQVVRSQPVQEQNPPEQTTRSQTISQDVTQAVDRLPTEESPSKPTSVQTKQKEAFKGQLQEVGVSSKTAEQAAEDLSMRKGGNDSPAIRKAHREYIAQDSLKQMYREIYTPLGVPSDVVEKAAIDAAKGQGANASENVRKAHDMVQANALDKTANIKQNPELTDSQRWEKYCEAFKQVRAEKYPGDKKQPSEYATMTGAAVQAFKAGVKREDIQSMLENCPANNPPRGDKATYAKGIVTRADKAAKKEMAGKANILPKSKQPSKSKSKGKKVAISAGIG